MNTCDCCEKFTLVSDCNFCHSKLCSVCLQTQQHNGSFVCGMCNENICNTDLVKKKWGDTWNCVVNDFLFRINHRLVECKVLS